MRLSVFVSSVIAQLICKRKTEARDLCTQFVFVTT
jgi:hypothetical protein